MCSVFIRIINISAIFGHSHVIILSCMRAQLLQRCPTLCDPVDWSLPASSVHGVLQARILEWVAMPSFRGSSQPRDWTQASCISCTAGKFFTNWATWEAPYLFLVNSKQSMKWGYSCPPSNYLHLQRRHVLIHAIHQKGSPTLLGKNIL